MSADVTRTEAHTRVLLLNATCRFVCRGEYSSHRIVPLLCDRVGPLGNASVRVRRIHGVSKNYSVQYQVKVGLFESEGYLD